MGLETPAQQFAVLSGLSLADQKRFLLMTLDESAQADAELEQLLAAWRKGDTSALAALLSDEFERFPQLYRPLTEDRNRAWVGQLDDPGSIAVLGERAVQLRKALELVG